MHGTVMFKQTDTHPLMSQVIAQVWRVVIDGWNWPDIRVPLFIGLRRNAKVLPEPMVTLNEHMASAQ